MKLASHSKFCLITQSGVFCSFFHTLDCVISQTIVCKVTGSVLKGNNVFIYAFCFSQVIKKHCCIGVCGRAP